LINFIITAPLLTHAVKIDMPQASNQPNPEKPDTITLSINVEGKLFWNDAPLEDAELALRLVTEVQRRSQLELHFRAERVTSYQKLAEIMSEAQSAGITRLGFVTDPWQKE
jgi:biopolymer transport protein ExbD